MKTNDGRIAIGTRLALAALLAVTACVGLLRAQTQPPIILPWNDVTHQVQTNGQVHVFSPLTTATTTPAFQALTMWDAYVLVVTGSPATCTFRLQGSMDGLTWFDIDASDVTCTAATTYVLAGGGTIGHPKAFVRGNLKTLTGGSSPTVTLQYAGQ